MGENLAAKIGKSPHKELVYPFNDEVVWDDENYLKVFEKKTQAKMYILF